MLLDLIGLEGGMNVYVYIFDLLSWVDLFGLYKGEGMCDLGKYYVFYEYGLNLFEY